MLVLEMLEVKDGVGCLEDLMMTSRRSSGCGACIPELTTRRHRGPWLCLGSRAKASTLEGRHRHFTGGSAFHILFRGFFSLLATQQKWYHHLQQVIHSLIPHKTTDNIGVPSKLHVAHTHTRTVTELFTYEVLLYSSLYLFENCCFHVNSGTVHPDIVHRNRKRALLTQSTVRESGNCYNRLPTYSSHSKCTPHNTANRWFVQVSSDVVAFCLRMIRSGSRFSSICGG